MIDLAEWMQKNVRVCIVAGGLEPSASPSEESISITQSKGPYSQMTQIRLRKVRSRQGRHVPEWQCGGKGRQVFENVLCAQESSFGQANETRKCGEWRCTAFWKALAGPYEGNTGN